MLELESLSVSGHAQPGTMSALFVLLVVVLVGVALFVSRRGPRIGSRRGGQFQLQSRPLLPVLAPSKESLSQVTCSHDIPQLLSSARSRAVSLSDPSSASVHQRAEPSCGTACSQQSAIASACESLATSPQMSPQLRSVGGPAASLSMDGVQCVTADSLLPHPPLPRIRTR